jgi:hypothetical protein
MTTQQYDFSPKKKVLGKAHPNISLMHMSKTATSTNGMVYFIKEAVHSDNQNTTYT